MVGEDSAEKGLSLLVQQVLGRPLDKTEQMSNWEKRPLRISQIRYAGMVLCMHTQTMTGRQMVAIEYHRLFCYPLTNCKPINSPLFPLSLSLLFPNLFLVADAYCLLDVYSVLSDNPAYFGLPADLRSISSGKSEKSDKKHKEKQAHGKEVRGQLSFLQQLLLLIVFHFYEVLIDTKCLEV